MPNDKDVTIWFNEHRLNALYEQGVDAENDLSEFLDSLYDKFVPAEKKEKIEKLIQTEQEESDRYYEQSRSFALLEIIENGTSCYCESDNCKTLFAVASRFVKALKTKKVQGKSLQGGLTDMAFGDCYETDFMYMQDYIGQYRGDTRVAFCAKINFDAGIIHDWNVGSCGWTEYNTERLTDGVRAATRKQNLTSDEREFLFEAKINEDNPEWDENGDIGMQMQ